jgi:hypothetical protein
MTVLVVLAVLVGGVAGVVVPLVGRVHGLTVRPRDRQWPA